jgi:hypothetical protein
MREFWNSRFPDLGIVYTASECVAGRELSSEGFRAFVKAADISAIPGTAERLIGEMLALEASGARLDCLRPYVYPATANEGSLAVDLVYASSSPLIQGIIYKSAPFKFAEWTKHDGPFLQVLGPLMYKDVKIPAYVPVPKNTLGLNVQAWAIERELSKLVIPDR